jgi:hypothetical protein
LPRKIESQSIDIPSLTVFENKLFMAYSTSNSSQLYQSQSDNSWDWYNTKDIDGQNTTTPALAVLGDELIMVYPSEGSHPNFISSHYTSARGWYSTTGIGQSAYQTALTACGEWLVMTYSDSSNSQLWCSRSRDGTSWQDTHQMSGQNGKFYPAMWTKDDTVVAVRLP